MKEFWNARYSEDGLAYGTVPNDFIKQCLDDREPGRVLFPAEGQGRNAIYAAKRGWQVDAFDYSEVARDKAIELANAAGVSINYEVQDMLIYQAPEACYDLIALSYVHLKPEWRKTFYPQLYIALKPGGELIKEGFRTTQLAYQHLSGGPKDETLLFTAEIIRSDFKDFEEIYLEELETTLSAGKYHVGPAHIIRYIGKKSNSSVEFS